ncbi:hypothetical protein KIM67_09870 [Flagellimonas sp. 389]|uniref:hypothetical protein n=1 Tax=Flagellimonas sp. 389 TaxID=2835862 RepID=UPI001BD6627D|nr:hypothetical protein [Flagellimonas sp. 389]MBS9462719.1 hypothetical protein [Flagellimonas sp. 389]
MNDNSTNKGLMAKHVFSNDGAVYVRSSQNIEMDEWSVINFYWMPVLQLEQELK